MVRARRAPAAGFTLVAAVILSTVLTVMLAIALPAVSKVVQRDNEEELIFRGLQYAEAIRVFQARNGRYPVSLDELIEVEPRSIRQLWAEPMSADGRWGLIYASAPGQVGGRTGNLAGGSGPLTVPGSLLGADPEGEEDEDEDDGDLGSEVGGGVSQPLSRQERRIRGRAGRGGTLGGGPITGVHSLSEKEALKSFLGGGTYKDWRFTVDILPNGTMTGENVPRLNASYVGRSIPQGVEALDGSGIDDDSEEEMDDEGALSGRAGGQRQDRKNRRNRDDG
jgi:type II secretory pathway pseudopilin PulG